MDEVSGRCGNCVFAATFSDDFKKRLCKGMPPQIVPVPTNGGIHMQMHYPLVEATFARCSLYQPVLPKLVDFTTLKE